MNFLNLFAQDSSTQPNTLSDNISDTIIVDDDNGDDNGDDNDDDNGDDNGDDNENRIAGENGTMQLTADAVGDVRLLLFSGVSRNTPREKIDTLIRKYINSINNNNKVEMICDLFVIMFEKRDCRGGEGEKQLFLQLFDKLYTKYPDLISATLHLIPFYGSWLDLWKIASMNNQTLNHDIYRISSDQIRKDIVAMKESRDNDITLCAKWTPSEKTKYYKKLCPNIDTYLKMIFPESTTLQKDYRQQIGLLREKIVVTEQLMCSGRWADINPKRTPSVCTNKHRKAFLNLSLKEDATADNWETGNRFPNNADRVKCRQRWMQAVKEKVIKGAQLDPVTLVDGVICATDDSELALLNSQYESLLQKIRTKIAKSVANGNDAMDNIIPMIDMSGSMSGLPMSAAIGLGIMMSELCNPKYGNTIITFTDTCDVVHLDNTLPFHERVKFIRSLRVGYSTNFGLAMERVRDIVLEKKLSQDELPSICILSDMQMNQNNMFGYSATTDEKIKRMFENIGNTICNEPYTRPRTVHWNLRADVQGFPVEAHENNVQSITGYSASLLDLILSGMPNPSPFDTMRRKLDEERYDQIRNIITPIVEGWR